MRSASADFDFGEVMERVQRVIRAIEPHDSVERYTGLGVDVAQGTARIVSPWEVGITYTDGRVQRLTTRAIVIAAGARPFVPPVPVSPSSTPTACSPRTTCGTCASGPSAWWCWVADRSAAN